MSKPPHPFERMSLAELRREAPGRLTPKEAAAILRVSRASLYRHIEDGLIPGVLTFGKRCSIRVDRDALLDWMSGAMSSAG